MDVYRYFVEVKAASHALGLDPGEFRTIRRHVAGAPLAHRKGRKALLDVEELISWAKRWKERLAPEEEIALRAQARPKNEVAK